MCPTLLAVVYRGVQWCTAGYSGVQLDTVIYSGVQWCTVVYSGVQWLTAVYNCVKLCKSVKAAICYVIQFIIFLVASVSRETEHKCHVKIT